jgi:Ni/Co efflux regulator RcnB
MGAYLPRAYWGSRYWWITDWRLWGLPAYQNGYRWVRVGPDALLVSTYNGRIVAVRHNVFW